MTTLARYSVFQIPSWIIVGVAVHLVRHWFGFAGWIAWLLLSLYVAKDFLLYPVLKKSYEVRRKPVLAHLIGERGTAVQDIAPNGYVRVHGEMWMAEAAPGSKIASGTAIRVEAVRGNTFVVARDDSVDRRRTG